MTTCERIEIREEQAQIDPMTMTDQTAIVRYLSASETFGSSEPVAHIETHISHVFLVGDRAYKMKKAISFAYLDYRQIEQRRKYCEIELALNRRTAPDLYLRTVAVTRSSDGELGLDGGGEPIEWLVEMSRFDQESILDSIAQRGELTADFIERTSIEIARFHKDAEISNKFGGVSGIEHVIDGIANELSSAPAEMIDPDEAEDWERNARQCLDKVRTVLESRKDRGKIRRCHGDLHLRNICALDGKPVLFDAIEFSEEIGTIDVLYDLAFLLMDLEHRDLRGHANAALNAYIGVAPDEIDGLAALPLFLSCRAAIRAHVSAAAKSGNGGRGATDAQAYLDSAIDYLSPPPPILIGIGGLSGSGKSTAARMLAPTFGAAPGAVVLRTDMIRKHLSGVDPTSRLPESAYTREASDRVYDALTAQATLAIASGHSVILDAVFARPDERARPERIAADVGVPFAGFWLDAQPKTMEKRVSARVGDASDAGPEVLKHQLDYPLGTITWRMIDAGGSRDDTFHRLERNLRAALTQPPKRNDQTRD